jgi:uncharacterized protein YndB with AHSA1/START domain
MAVATNNITLCHFAAEVDFGERFTLGAEVERFNPAHRLVIEFELEVAVVEVTVGTGFRFFPRLHQQSSSAL